MKIVTGKPLTLDQLHKINDEPVWVQDFGSEKRSGWKLIHWDRGKYITFLGIAPGVFLLEEYGQTWVAFEYEPKAYEDTRRPCDLCKDVDRIWGYALALKISYGQAFRLGRSEGEFKFCPRCGRPLDHTEITMEEVMQEAGREVLGEGTYIEYGDPFKNEMRDRAITEKVAERIPRKFAELYGYEMPVRIAPKETGPYRGVELVQTFDDVEE